MELPSIIQLYNILQGGNYYMVNTAKDVAETTVSTPRPFGIRDKIGYMMGDFGCNCSFTLVSSYFMLFYVTVLGINPIHYGILVFVVKVCHAINDPIVGALTDYFQPKNGDKFRPWIKYAAVPMALITAIIFLYIPEVPYGFKLTQCIITYLLWGVLYTCINVPYGSLQSVITADSVERAELSRYRSIGAMLVQLSLGIVLPMIIYVNNNPSGPRFTLVGIVLGAISLIAFMILYKFSVERNKNVAQEGNQEKFNYFRTMKAFFKNRPMIGITIASVAMIVFFHSTRTMNQYVFITYFKQPKLLSLGTIVSFGPTLISIIFVKKAVEKWGKKNICSWPFLGAVVAYLVLLLPIKNPYVWFIIQGIASLMAGFNSLLIWALVADCIDYQEYQTGRREEGSIYATYSLFRKIAQGVGASLISFLLAATGYQASLQADQLPGVPERIRLVAVLLPLIGSIIIFISMKFIYNLDEAKLAEVHKKLGHKTE